LTDHRFLLTHLFLGLLKDKLKTDDITATLDELKKLPRDLNESGFKEKLMFVYSKVVDQINLRTLDVRRLAQAIFTWLTFAQTSFTSVQLRNAFAIKIGISSLNVSERDLHPIDEILSACAGLVRVDRENDTIRFIHSTVKDFFKVQLCAINTKSVDSSTQDSGNLQDFDMSLMEAHRQLAMACVTYLNFDEFRAGPCRTEKELIRRFEDYPLYKYAAENWGLHAKHVIDCLDPSDSEILFSFLQDRLKVGAASQAQNYDRSGSHKLLYFNTTQQIIPKCRSALHVATSFRLTSIVKRLLAKGQDPDAVDELSMTPLCQAAAVGDVDIVELLLTDQYRANPAHKSLDGTPLVLAAANGHEKVVKVLLTKDINSKGLALIMASNKGHQAVIMQLMEAGVEPNESGINTVDLARQNGNRNVENILAEHGATGLELVPPQVAREIQDGSFDANRRGQIHNRPLDLNRTIEMTAENDSSRGYGAAVGPSFQHQYTTFPFQDQASVPPQNTANFPIQHPTAARRQFQTHNTAKISVHQAATKLAPNQGRPRAELKADSVAKSRRLGASADSRLGQSNKPSSLKAIAAKLKVASRVIASPQQSVQQKRQSTAKLPAQHHSMAAPLPQYWQVEAHITPNPISRQPQISRYSANSQSRIGANSNDHANDYKNGFVALQGSPRLPQSRPVEAQQKRQSTTKLPAQHHSIAAPLPQFSPVEAQQKRQSTAKLPTQHYSIAAPLPQSSPVEAQQKRQSTTKLPAQHHSIAAPLPQSSPVEAQQKRQSTTKLPTQHHNITAPLPQSRPVEAHITPNPISRQPQISRHSANSQSRIGANSNDIGANSNDHANDYENGFVAQQGSPHLPQSRPVEAHITPNPISRQPQISRHSANGQSCIGANSNDHANNYGNGFIATPLPQSRPVEAHIIPNPISRQPQISRHSANGQSRIGANSNDHANDYGNRFMAQQGSPHSSSFWPFAKNRAVNGHGTQTAHVNPRVGSSHNVKSTQSKPTHVTPTHVNPRHVKTTHVEPAQVKTIANGAYGKKWKAQGKENDADTDVESESDDPASDSDDPASDSEDDLDDNDKSKLLKMSKEEDSHDEDDDSEEDPDSSDHEAEDSSDEDVDIDNSSDDEEETLLHPHGHHEQHHNSEDSSDNDNNDDNNDEDPDSSDHGAEESSDEDVDTDNSSDDEEETLLHPHGHHEQHHNSEDSSDNDNNDDNNDEDPDSSDDGAEESSDEDVDTDNSSDNEEETLLHPYGYHEQHHDSEDSSDDNDDDDDNDGDPDSSDDGAEESSDEDVDNSSDNEEETLLHPYGYHEQHHDSEDLSDDDDDDDNNDGDPDSSDNGAEESSDEDIDNSSNDEEETLLHPYGYHEQYHNSEDSSDDDDDDDDDDEDSDSSDHEAEESSDEDVYNSSDDEQDLEVSDDSDDEHSDEDSD
jgi:hypothetical protein